MLIPLGVTFCNLNSGINHKNLNEYLSKPRSHIGVLLTKLSKTSTTLLHMNVRKSFHRTHIKLRDKQWCQCHWKVSNCKAKHLDYTSEEEKEEEVGKATLIWRAIKLPIYSVALVPLTVGGATAYMQTGRFLAWRYLYLLAFSVLIITWLNLSNDVYDFDTGADKNKKESVVNMLGSRAGTFIAAYLSLALGLMGLTQASVQAGNLQSMLLLICAIICGYIYQCPPFRLSYQGLGEPLCFAAFGPFATTAFYLLLGSTSEINKPPISCAILCASVLVGFTTTLILFCSHFHQVEEDMAVGKLSPLVRLGTKRGSDVVRVAVMALYSLLFAFGLSRALPAACILLCALTAPIGKLVVSFVQENYKDKGKIFMAKYYCVRLHALFGVALATGLVVTKRFLPRLKF
ncbi:2-carboxy-1,4-naphthoquinone phytyltransferase, chloroplastic isoform X2 [Tripterygium wilfordii]|uniref:2-carboxy-1,4-naphthoquinone phytyltransferase, chloroplastic isoform X2 n=1 Tax=Tripterygium wilfordii TaxID=458696 RepID=UPI0018F8075D|nr:2-carboxy-1,4-naphthoquinone phytyltransferase, chloroplastic isoform X2 [Tripterygium wilfordii]